MQLHVHLVNGQILSSRNMTLEQAAELSGFPLEVVQAGRKDLEKLFENFKSLTHLSFVTTFDPNGKDYEKVYINPANILFVRIRD